MKKLLCLAISVAMLLSALVVCVGASATLPTNLGYSADAVVAVPLDAIPNINELATAEGYDLEAYQAGTEWKITDVAGMKMLATLANELAGNGAIGDSCLGRTFYLANDIDMTGVTDYIPIGNDNANAAENRASGHRFSGTFDGQGHTIKNLVMTSDAEGVVELGVFGTLKGAIVKNLVIDSTCSFTYTGTSGGARVGSLAAKIANQGDDGNKGTVNVETEEPLFYSNIIENVKNEATVSASAGNAGGLVGVLYSETSHVVKISGVTVIADVTAKQSAGGIIGTMNGRHLEISNCGVQGDITAKYYAAGIVPSTEMANEDNQKISTVKNCTVIGTITANDAEKLYFELIENAFTATDCNVDGATTVKVAAGPWFGYDSETTVAYTGDVGYSADRVVQKDLTNVLPICEFVDAPAGTNEFKISCPMDYMFFVTIINNGLPLKDYTIYLENDLDMTGFSVQPIGAPTSEITTNPKSGNCFSGTFDGQGHVIDNLEITSEAGSKGEEWVLVGMFGSLKGGTVKNLVLGEGCSFSYTGDYAVKSCVGAIAAYVTRNGGSSNGEEEFAFRSYIDNCYSAATVSGKRSVGGILGYVDGNTNHYAHHITNCTNAGEVTSKEWAAGIVAYGARRLEVINCRNIGKITLVADAAATNKGAAGIYAAPAKNVGATVISGCINNGVIAGPGTLGGIVARMEDSNINIKNCTQFGSTVLDAGSTNTNVGPMYGYTTLVAFAHMSNNANQAGKADATLADATLALDNLVFPDYQEINNTHDHSAMMPDDGGDEGEDTSEPSDTTAKPNGSETTAPKNDGTTATTDTSSEKKGCGSVVTAGALTVLLTVALAGVTLSKKED